jgi:hypothetical protein
MDKIEKDEKEDFKTNINTENFIKFPKKLFDS